jgi:hypothetical protein
VAYVSGGGSGMYRYQYNDGYGTRHVNTAGTFGWVPLGIREYPDAVDHVLPYTFDLLWDVKQVSSLVYMLLHKESYQGHDFDHEDAEDVLGWLDDTEFWEGSRLTPKDFRRIRRCLRVSFNLVKKE